MPEIEPGYAMYRAVAVGVRGVLFTAARALQRGSGDSSFENAAKEVGDFVTGRVGESSGFGIVLLLNHLARRTAKLNHSARRARSVGGYTPKNRMRGGMRVRGVRRNVPTAPTILCSLVVGPTTTWATLNHSQDFLLWSQE